MRTTRLKWWGLGMVGAFALTACGGGGTGSKDTGGGPPVVTGNYSDVRGYNVAAGQEEVRVDRWPSWLHEGQLVDACAPGEASYADRCWGTVNIDADAGTVEFLTTGVGSEVLSLGAMVPTVLGSMVTSEAPVGACVASGGARCVWPHRANTGYVMMAGPGYAGSGYSGMAVWDTPIATVNGGRPTIRGPWALGNKLLLDSSGLVTGVLVKTTQLYGFVTTKTVPSFYDFTIVHNWSYRGSVKVAGTVLNLPLRLGDIATALSATVGRTGDGSGYIDTPNHRVRFVSQKDVIQARTDWGGSGTGLSESDLVTSVEMQTTAMSAP